jgi:hypothetical protein
MSVTGTNLIQGPGELYTGDFGAAEPADSAVNTSPSASVWTDVGATKDGVTLNVTQEYAELEVDQLVDVPERRLTKRDFQVMTNMAEPTLENLALALNGGTVTSSSAYKTYDPDDASSATQPTYKALLFRGYAPRTALGATMRRNVIVRKVLSIQGVEAPYKKDDQTLFPVTFGAHWVSSSVKPFRIIDQLTA